MSYEIQVLVILAVVMGIPAFVLGYLHESGRIGRRRELISMIVIPAVTLVVVVAHALWGDFAEVVRWSIGALFLTLFLSQGAIVLWGVVEGDGAWSGYRVLLHGDGALRDDTGEG